MYDEIKEAVGQALSELITVGKLTAGNLVVVGCSSSEVCGEKIGTSSTPEVADVIFETVYGLLKEKGIFLAAQCCEHLNRALITEKKAAEQFGYAAVNVVPQIKAGGSFATAAYHGFEHPVAVEHIRADAGLDIGDTFIGMHLKEVAVPVRLSVKEIGCAHLTAARVRPKFIGGCRAVYDENLL